MAVDRKQQMKEITERLEQGVKDIFTSEMYTTYALRSLKTKKQEQPAQEQDKPKKAKKKGMEL